jgi:hypothetical protein
VDQPNQNSKAGNDRRDFVRQGHIFPVHCFLPFLIQLQMVCGSSHRSTTRADASYR